MSSLILPEAIEPKALAAPQTRLGNALEAMPSDTASGVQASLPRPLRRRLAFAIVLTATAISAPHFAAAEDVAPFVSPDRIDDLPSTKPDPFPAFDNFAWRAFVALNWPSRLDADGRDVPDRAKSLGDPGPRCGRRSSPAMSCFKSPRTASLWRPRLGRATTAATPTVPRSTIGWRLASFVPFADFNQPRLHPPRPRQSPGCAERRLYALRNPHQQARVLDPGGQRLSQGKNLPDEDHAAHLPVGSIAVKAAWRPLTAADPLAVRARYYVVKDAKMSTSPRRWRPGGSFARKAIWRWSGCISRSRPSIGRNGSGAPSSISTTCPSRRRRALFPLRRFEARPRTMAASGHTNRSADRLEQSAEDRSSADAGGPQTPDP